MFIKREEKNIFQQKNLFSNFKNSSNFESGPAHSQNMLNLKKRKSENLAKRKQEIQILINTNY